MYANSLSAKRPQKKTLFNWFYPTRIHANQIKLFSLCAYSMYVPPELTHRIENISKRLGSDLDIVRCWKSDFREGTLYCDFRGIVHRSQDILIEVAGTLCAELSQDRNDEVDIFLFVNGKRVGLMEKPFQYLIGFGDSKLAWDYNDEGFDQFDRLDDKTFSNPIDESLVIHPPNNNPDEG